MSEWYHNDRVEIYIERDPATGRFEHIVKLDGEDISHKVAGYDVKRELSKDDDPLVYLPEQRWYTFTFTADAATDG